MKMFVWKRVHNATSNWHPEGGVMVVAETLDRAKELATAEGVSFDKSDKEPSEYELVDKYHESVVIFPDTGCC